jgi:ribosomal protein S15P/S13E
VNASPQRREAFIALQTKEPRLIPIQDVRTRWNSTFLMLSRAKKLQSIIDQYCTTHQYVQFKLDQEEWRQIEYLLLITKPFFDYTTILSKTNDVTVHSIFSIYNELFNHIDASEKQLKRKAVPWKKQMLRALQAARKKLAKYYKATDTGAHGDIYAIATILSPSKKLQYFTNKDWKGEIDFVKQYRKVLEKEFVRYQQELSGSTELVEVDSILVPTGDFNDLDMIGESQATVQSAVEQEDDEITRYLAKGEFFYPNNHILY